MNDIFYMQRCLQLAAQGRSGAKPNPMVGAVIVWQAPDGSERILGEGYHVRCGEGHAEVNAFRSVREEDEALLKDAVMYVSLEPCSHYGKTPPCADLIVRKGVRRVVVGCIDPFAEVSGRGVRKLQEAGIEVTVGVLEEECRRLNRRFFTFHEKKRPYIILKWAQSADGKIDRDGTPLQISTPFTRMLMHRQRADVEAILVGRVTEEREHPALTTRHWPGKSPEKIVLSHDGPSIEEILRRLHAENKQALMVEGGKKTLDSFIAAGLWDEIRVETGTVIAGGGTPAPALPSSARLAGEEGYDGNVIRIYQVEG